MAVNPFDIKAPDITQSMIDDAVTAAYAPFPGAAGNASSATSTDDSPFTYSSDNLSSANTYSADQGSTTDWNVKNKQTVAGQLQGILAANSPLLQQAKTNALQQMNGRGLLNSSMAIGAGQNAVIQNALPIAQADATMYGNAAQFNANAANNMSQFNANASNTASQFNKGAQNQFDLADQAATNAASQFNAAQNADVAKFNAQQSNVLADADAAREQQANMATADNANKLLMQSLDNSFKAAIASADAQTKVQLQQIDAVTRTSLAETEAQYKQLMQSTASATELYQQTIKNINDIAANPDLDADSVTSAIDRQINALKDGMSLIDSLNTSVDGLRDLVTFT